MIPNNKLNKMLNIYSKITKAKLINTPAVSSPSPVETDVYISNVPATWNNPIDGVISANSFEFSPIGIGSTPNCIVLNNDTKIWKPVGGAESLKLYYKSIYDILISAPVDAAQALLGHKIGSTVYDYIIYQVSQSIYDNCTFKEQHTAQGLETAEELYPIVYNPAYDGSPPIIGHSVNNGYTTLYFVQKSVNFENGAPVSYKSVLEPIYSIAFNLDDHKNEELIFTAISSITIPNTNIALKKEV